jgi:hypothetical protein
MRTCHWLRASPGNESREVSECRTLPIRANAHTRRRLAIMTTLLGWIGWRALQDLLNAIPDSNDDFGLF